MVLLYVTSSSISDEYNEGFPSVFGLLSQTFAKHYVLRGAGGIYCVGLQSALTKSSVAGRRDANDSGTTNGRRGRLKNWCTDAELSAESDKKLTIRHVVSHFRDCLYGPNYPTNNVKALKEAIWGLRSDFNPSTSPCYCNEHKTVAYRRSSWARK